MKILVCLLALACLWAPGRSFAAQRDSLGHGRLAVAAVPLIMGGAAMTFCDRDFRDLRNSYAVGFRHDYDDYLQYAPLAFAWGLKACGVRSRSSWGRMIVSNAFSAALMAAMVNSLKYSVRAERPDGSTRNSFPSGHAATAFMAASILHKEFGHRSPWFSVGGYVAAAATGITRQLNNRHWMSDIMVGAGIGILSVELGYLFADLIYRERGIADTVLSPISTVSGGRRSFRCTPGLLPLWGVIPSCPAGRSVSQAALRSGSAALGSQHLTSGSAGGSPSAACGWPSTRRRRTSRSMGRRSPSGLVFPIPLRPVVPSGRICPADTSISSGCAVRSAIWATAAVRR